MTTKCKDCVLEPMQVGDEVYLEYCKFDLVGNTFTCGATLEQKVIELSEEDEQV